MLFFFQAEDGIRYLVRSRGLGDVYKRQLPGGSHARGSGHAAARDRRALQARRARGADRVPGCLLYTSDAADERSSVDLGGRRIIKKKKDAREDRHHTVATPNTHIQSHTTKQRRQRVKPRNDT